MWYRLPRIKPVFFLEYIAAYTYVFIMESPTEYSAQARRGKKRLSIYKPFEHYIFIGQRLFWGRRKKKIHTGEGGWPPVRNNFFLFLFKPIKIQSKV